MKLSTLEWVAIALFLAPFSLKLETTHTQTINGVEIVNYINYPQAIMGPLGIILAGLVLWKFRSSTEIKSLLAVGLVTLLGGAFHVSQGFGLGHRLAALPLRDQIEKRDLTQQCKKADGEACLDLCRIDAKTCYDLGTAFFWGRSQEGIMPNKTLAGDLLVAACQEKYGVSCKDAGIFFRDGALGEKDPQKALIYFHKACDYKYAAGCNLAGVVLEGSDKVPQNPKKGIEYYETACRLGSSAGCYNLGLKIFQGEHRIFDHEKVMKLYTKGCNGNIGEACRELGLAFSDQHSKLKPPVDQVKATALFKQGCDADHGDSCNFLGFRNEKGYGSPVNLQSAVDLYKKACQLNHGLACKNWGIAHLNGLTGEKNIQQARLAFQRGCTTAQHADSCWKAGNAYEVHEPKNIAEAVAFYVKGCDLRHGSSCNTAAIMLEEGQGIAQDVPRATQYYEKSCDLGNKDGCHNFGIQLHEGLGIVKDQKKSMVHFERGCELNHPGSCNRVANAYFVGNHGYKNDSQKAIQFLLQSCDLEAGWGCYNLGKIYEEGNQVAKNLPKAKDFYKKSCEGGIKPACEKL